MGNVVSLFCFYEFYESFPFPVYTGAYSYGGAAEEYKLEHALFLNRDHPVAQKGEL